MHMRIDRLWWRLGGLVILVAGCAVQINQPNTSTPYALLKFSAAMHLIGIDDQSISSPASIPALRVTPGQHTLRFVHVNAGPEGSAQHVGQYAAPFTLNVREGIAYQFEAKT